MLYSVENQAGDRGWFLAIEGDDYVSDAAFDHHRLEFDATFQVPVQSAADFAAAELLVDAIDGHVESDDDHGCVWNRVFVDGALCGMLDCVGHE